MMSLVVMVSCTNEIDLSSYEAVPEATRSSKERVYGDCSVDGDNLSLLLTMPDKGFESSFNCYGKASGLLHGQLHVRMKYTVGNRNDADYAVAEEDNGWYHYHCYRAFRCGLRFLL